MPYLVIKFSELARAAKDGGRVQIEFRKSFSEKRYPPKTYLWCEYEPEIFAARKKELVVGIQQLFPLARFGFEVVDPRKLGLRMDKKRDAYHPKQDKDDRFINLYLVFEKESVDENLN